MMEWLQLHRKNAKLLLREMSVEAFDSTPEIWDGDFESYTRPIHALSNPTSRQLPGMWLAPTQQ